MNQRACSLNGDGERFLEKGFRQHPEGSADLKYFRIAAEYFRRAHTLDPENPLFLLNLADVNLALDHTKEGMDYFNRAVVKLIPNLPEHQKYLNKVTDRWRII